MLSAALINAPFASLRLPSLALTQLKCVLDSTLRETLSTEVLYLNQDFAQYMGLELYQSIAVDMEAPYNGLGDWFFRQAAFPDLADNSELYFQRFFPRRTEQHLKLRRAIEDKRHGVAQVLDELIDRYGLHERTVVGFTSMFSQNVACFALAKRIKDRNPDTVIVMGGANCETPMGEEIVKNVEAVDYVFSGGALRSFPRFLQTLADGDTATREAIPGLFSKARPHAAPGVASVGEEMPLDEPVELDYDPFFESLDKHFPGARIDPILLFETSRGCWWGQRAHCTFCGLNGLSMNYRAMRADLARDLIRSLFKYAPRVSRLQCVDNIMPKNYPKEVFADLDTPGHMKIFYEVKADLTDEDLQLLSRARVREVQPGIEALATSTLKLMKKGTTVFQNLRFLAGCAMRDIFPCWSLLVGFPGEKGEVFEKYVADIPKLVHLPPPSGVYPVRPDRYSPYHVRAREYGLELKPADFYEMVYPFDRSSVENLAYFFRDQNFAADYFTAMVEWFEPVRAQVELWRNRWNHKDYPMPPMLYLSGTGGSAIVHDSRSGTSAEHQLGEAGWIILQSLGKPRRRSDVVADLVTRGIDAERELQALERAGLLFSEGDHTMSLVLPTKPSWSDGLDGWSWAA